MKLEEWASEFDRKKLQMGMSHCDIRSEFGGPFTPTMMRDQSETIQLHPDVVIVAARSGCR